MRLKTSTRLTEPELAETQLRQARSWSERQWQVIEILLADLRHADQQRRHWHRLMAQEVLAKPVLLSLVRLCGIREIIAFALGAFIGDIKRFASPKKLVKYVGLNPAFDDSGNSEWHGGIGGHGHKLLRSLLIEGAQAILRCSQTPLARWGRKLLAAKGSVNLAVAAIARKLTVALWYLTMGRWTALEELGARLLRKVSSLIGSVGEPGLKALGKIRKLYREEICQRAPPAGRQDHAAPRAGQAWLEAHSARADSLSPAQVEEFVARFENSARDPERRISPATITRFLQPIRQCWTWAVSRDDILIDRSPWVVVRSRKKVKGKATMATGRTALAVDADMVLSVPQSLALAQACVSEGSWGGIVECFVLVMALCGLRWGEAAGLLLGGRRTAKRGRPGVVGGPAQPPPKGGTLARHRRGSRMGAAQGPRRHRDPPRAGAPTAGHQAAPSPRTLRRRARRARLPPQQPAVQQLQLRPQRLGAGPVQDVPPPSRSEAERSTPT